MVDILGIPLFYIAFRPNENIDNHYKKYGFKNVNHFPAIDGRKLDPTKLKADNIITIRSYDDLKSGRVQHSGMSSLGAIGCTLSHYKLWSLCVHNSWPYIIVTEEDNVMTKKLTPTDTEKISDAIQKKNGIFISARPGTQEHRIHFMGTHFYIASRDACVTLIENCFPIDVQTDWYLAHLATTGKLSVHGYKISVQDKQGSTIQDACIMCYLPKNNIFYIIIITLIVMLTIMFIHFVKKC
jgi:hypothetical protein